MSMSATGAQAIPGRTYAYDSLNRLITMSASGDPSGCTGLSWTYNAWGNRSAQTVTGGSCPDAFTTTFTQNNNRMDSYSYDAAGNLLGDGTHTYTYDGEGRILTVDAGSTATYVYDAEGRRIEKIKGSAQTHYWYGTDGQVRAEWNQSGALQNDYVYLGGKMLAQYTSTTTMFAHLDHLGSTRLMTAVNGSTAECDDYLPFGEQLSYSGTHPCSNTADTTHKFTGQERDTETNLDKFEARYYSSTTGRFMIPDWDVKPVTVPCAHFGNPQSLNLYVYISNNPLTFADPDGHDAGTNQPAPGSGNGDDMFLTKKEEVEAEQGIPETGEGSAANLSRRAAIADAARAHDGDTSMPYTENHPTCNLFVARAVSESGAPKLEVMKADGHMGAPSAAELSGDRIPSGWRKLAAGESPQPGDIAARKEHFVDATGHSGIVTSVSKSGVVTAMAAHQTKIGTDMSFQPGTKQSPNPSVYLRYTGN